MRLPEPANPDSGSPLVEKFQLSLSAATLTPELSKHIQADPRAGRAKGKEAESSHVVNVCITPPKMGARKPAAVICILDVSSSMSLHATDNGASNGNDKDDTEAMGFSRLDLVKHSVNTLMSVLEEQDSLAIVTFSNSAELKLSHTAMDLDGKQMAKRTVDSLQPSGSTNIFDGLRIGLELAHPRNGAAVRDKNVVLLLLTDGEPNINPPRGIMPTLKRFIADQDRNYTIHTFGFGYSLDSQLLAQIASAGNGSYAYIPDCSMVGTIFVNFTSNAMATVSRVNSLTITPLNETRILRILGYDDGDSEDDDESNGNRQLSQQQQRATTIDLGLVQYGQSRNVVLLIDANTDKTTPGSALLKATVRYDDGQLVEMAEMSATLEEQDIISVQNGDELFGELWFQFARSYLVTTIAEAMRMASKDNIRPAQLLLKQTHALLSSKLPIVNDSTKTLLRDVKSDKDSEAQASKSFSKQEWYTKWGRHYLPSLIRAHLLQQCNNFKDPGVQQYGGTLFTQLRNAADDLFCKLPPPRPSIAQVQNKQGVYVATSAPKDMSRYYRQSGGCFHGCNNVTMADGTTLKKVEHIQAGDIVQCSAATQCSASVVCVVKIAIPGGMTELVQLLDNGPLLTPYHPVRSQGKWAFPCEITPAKVVACDYVYNFVLNRGHTMTVQGAECVTLGHGLTDDIVMHPFFGTDKVIQNLRAMPGWDGGYIHCDNLRAVRDNQTGMICEWVH